LLRKEGGGGKGELPFRSKKRRGVEERRIRDGYRRGRAAPTEGGPSRRKSPLIEKGPFP